MPWGLERHQASSDLHFVTFSCYRRLPYLNSANAKRRVEAALESARRQYGMAVFGYVMDGDGATAGGCSISGEENSGADVWSSLSERQKALSACGASS
jgi:hypothetical protein